MKRRNFLKISLAALAVPGVVAASPGIWRANSGALDLAMLEGVECWGGLDLAGVADFATLRLVWIVDGVLFTAGRRWLPAVAVVQRAEYGTGPYAAWVKAGLIERTEGDIVDQAAVERGVDEWVARFKIKELAFDPWSAFGFANRMAAKGTVTMVEFRQSMKSYHPAMQALKRHYVNGTLRHGEDPMLAWCMSNLVQRFDRNLNGRQRPVDDAVALLMATGRAIANKAMM